MSSHPTSPSPAASAPVAGAPAAKQRDPWLDNAKWLLVTLVVIGHAWTLLPSRPVIDQLYDWLYLWHIPAFVLVTGYLSRRMEWTGAKVWQNVRTLAVPYLLFEAAMALFRIYVGGENLADLWLDPHWPLWYLAATFCWRMMVPALRAIPAALVVAVVLSVSVQLLSNTALDYLDVARVLGFLPFFVIGLKIRPEHLELARRPAARVAGVVVMLATLVAARFIDSVGSTEWLYYRSSYSALGEDAWAGIGIKLGLLALGLVCAFAFLALTPTSRTWFSAMGAATMIVYLFHGFAVKGAEYAGYQDWAVGHPYVAVVPVVLAAVAISVLLAWPPVAKRLERVVDPFGHVEKRTQQAVAVAAVATDPVPEAVQEVVEITEAIQAAEVEETTAAPASTR